MKSFEVVWCIHIRLWENAIACFCFSLWTRSWDLLFFGRCVSVLKIAVELVVFVLCESSAACLASTVNRKWCQLCLSIVKKTWIMKELKLNIGSRSKFNYWISWAVLSCTGVLDSRLWLTCCSRGVFVWQSLIFIHLTF